MGAQGSKVTGRLSKKDYEAQVPALREALLDAQFDLDEADDFSVVVVLGGLAGAGKGDLARRLNEWMDPRRIDTWAFTAHSDEEAQRPPMWRYWRVLPPKGRIAIFFEAWYAHPMGRYLRGEIDDAGLDLRTGEIARFETMLARENVLVLKFWLDLSKEEQKARLDDLADDERTAWKVSAEDLIEHDGFETRNALAARMHEATDTALAPWRIVPAADIREMELEVGRQVKAAIRARLGGGVPGREPETKPPSVAAGPHPLDTLDLSKKLKKSVYKEELAYWQARLNKLSRDPRFARRSAVLAFEGHDAAGKGGAIRRLAAALDARYYQIYRIGAPTAEEHARPFLWRFWMRLPRHGNIAVFDRSWYGRVLVERVEGYAKPHEWARAYDEINDFEANLIRNGVIVSKFWLSISKKEQLERFEARQETGYKRFKITDDDWRNRDKWDAYRDAIGDMIRLTSTDIAPWTLVEAENKRYARIKVLRSICERLEESL